MSELLEFLSGLANTTDKPSMWSTGNWTVFEGWLYILSDSILWVSFLIISITATRFAGKTGKGVMGRLSPVIIWHAFGTSIVLFMDVFMFWVPAYRLNSLMRVCAAVVSIVAVYKLHKYIPELLALRPAGEIEQQDLSNTAAEEHIRTLEAELKKAHEERAKEAANVMYANELVSEFQALLKQSSEGRDNEVTEMRKAYEDLRFINDGLEKKVAERTMQMEAISRELDAFSYAVSHDMRAPLRIINGYTDMLHTDHHHVMDAEGKRLLEIILINTKQMGGMIEALLTLARIGRKELMILPTDMTSIIKSSIGEQVSATGSKATFNIGEIMPVNCDSVLIRSVWSNLIANAIKYSANVEQPVIHIGSEKKEGKVMYFIKDNGVGFDMEYVHKLFGVFQRLHKTKDDTGAGTGLALVQRVILKHGGYIWAEGEMNKGATFYFTLPENNN